MEEYILEILTGGIVLFMAAWVVPISLTLKAVRKELDEVKAHLGLIPEEVEE
jgi:hypothetical protein